MEWLGQKVRRQDAVRVTLTVKTKMAMKLFCIPDAFAILELPALEPEARRAGEV